MARLPRNHAVKERPTGAVVGRADKLGSDVSRKERPDETVNERSCEQNQGTTVGIPASQRVAGSVRSELSSFYSTFANALL